MISSGIYSKAIELKETRATCLVTLLTKKVLFGRIEKVDEDGFAIRNNQTSAYIRFEGIAGLCERTD